MKESWRSVAISGYKRGKIWEVVWYSSSRLVFVTSSAIWRYDDLSFSALHTIRWDIAVVLLLLFFLVPTVKHKHPNQFWVCSSGFLLSLYIRRKLLFSLSCFHYYYHGKGTYFWLLAWWRFHEQNLKWQSVLSKIKFSQVLLPCHEI